MPIQNKDTLDVLLDDRYPESYLGMSPIPVTGPVGNTGMEIRRAYLGDDPSKPFHGKILAVLKYKDRAYSLLFHVWSEHQRPEMANRMSEIEELAVRDFRGMDLLEHTETDLFRKAFWMRTPASELNDDELALRAVAAKLKSYSVEHKLCLKFRRALPDVPISGYGDAGIQPGR